MTIWTWLSLLVVACMVASLFFGWALGRILGHEDDDDEPPIAWTHEQDTERWKNAAESHNRIDP